MRSNQPAFPSDSGGYGLSKREYMALKLLQSIVPEEPCYDQDEREELANEAVELADALLKRLEQSGRY